MAILFDFIPTDLWVNVALYFYLQNSFCGKKPFKFILVGVVLLVVVILLGVVVVISEVTRS